MSHIGAAGLIFKDTLNDLVFELEFARGPPASTRTPRASKARTRHTLASTRDPGRYVAKYEVVSEGRLATYCTRFESRKDQPANTELSTPHEASYPD